MYISQMDCFADDINNHRSPEAKPTRNDLTRRGGVQEMNTTSRAPLIGASVVPTGTWSSMLGDLDAGKLLSVKGRPRLLRSL